MLPALVLVRREDLNYRLLVCVCLWLCSDCFNCVLVAYLCMLFFPQMYWRCYSVATWRGFGLWGYCCSIAVGSSQNYILSWMWFAFYAK